MKIFKVYFPLKNFSFTSLTSLCAFGQVQWLLQQFVPGQKGKRGYLRI